MDEDDETREDLESISKTALWKSDDELHHLIWSYLANSTFPANFTEGDRKIVKKKAARFCLLDGELYFGIAEPKKVISDPTERQRVIHNYHIDEETQAHRSGRETHKLLSKSFYWRNSLKAVFEYLKSCEPCRREKENHPTDETDPKERIRHVWRKVNLTQHGPFHDKLADQQVFVLTLEDSYSKWISAAIVLDKRAEGISNFVFSTFCQFGFAQCLCNGFDEQQPQDIMNEISALWNGLSTKAVDPMQLFTFLIEETPQPTALSTKLQNFISTHPGDWTKRLDSWLFDQRTAEADLGTPFSLMFGGRDPLNCIDDNIPIAVETSRKRRRLKNSLLRCGHCDDSFTSRISFQIHQRRHIDEAGKRGEADGESPSQSPMKFVEDESLPGEPSKRRRPTAPVVRRHKAAKRSSAVDAAPIQDENLLREVTDSTVNAVKALLAATKQERTKRGKYVKYTNEMKDEIAEYAIKNGHVDAARVYGEKLGCVISESTIRNFVRAYNQCAPMLKEEVGRHAYQYGIESCLKAFEGKLGVEINRKIVRRYKQYFLDKNPGLKDVEDDETGESLGTFDATLRDEIGKYAFEYGNQTAVEHFSHKLQFPMKEATVRRFKRAFMEKNGLTVHSEAQQIIAVQVQQEQQAVPTSDEGVAGAPMESLYTCVLPAQQTTGTTGQFDQQQFAAPTTLVVNGQAGHFQIVQPAPFGHTQPQQIVMGTPSTQTFTSEAGSFVPVTSEYESPVSLVQPIQLAATSDDQQITIVTTDGSMAMSAGGNEELMGEQQTVLVENGEGTFTVCTLATEEQQPAEGEEAKEDEEQLKEEDDEEFVPSKKGRSPRKSKGRRSGGRTHRGQYANYGPEMRAEIGKYAVNHSNIETIIHFRKVHGLELPESTVRGIRDKYLSRSSGNDQGLDELDYGKRGRPIRLGKYDAVVANCIKELVKSGEKVSSFLAIATAKQVLLQHEPSLLEEYGGSVQLNLSWAKSFLKRIGVKRSQQTDSPEVTGTQ